MKFLVLFLVLSSSVFAQSGDKVRFRVSMDKMGIVSQQLPSYMDVAGLDVENNSADIIASYDYYQKLKDEGYPVEIIEEQPLALDDRYLQPAEIVSIIENLKEEYPHLVHAEQIGKTLMGRPIYAVRLSTKDKVQYKPSILFNGMHHAREIMTTEVTTDIMTYLAQNYDNPDTPWVASWLENIAVWVIPQVNPDGNSIVWSKDNWWRKNARGGEWGTWGVDLNRNYPYNWGACGGSSGSKRSQTYRGKSGGSEPETQAMMKLVKRENFAINISYHSYSELVIAPYGCKNSYTPEDFIFQDLGRKFAKKLIKDNGKGSYTYGTGWELLYPVDGEDIGWMYNEQNTLAYVVEVNSTSQGFQPDYDKWRNPTILKQRKGWHFLLNRLLGGAQIRGRMLDADTGAPVDGVIKVVGTKYNTESPRKSKDGVFYKILTPGEFEIEFSAKGYESEVVAISLDNAAVEWNVYLTKTFL
jgi:hypothetical protein